MMILKITRGILAVTLLLTISQSYAQDYVSSALQFGRTKPGGSARILAIGGAQIALGGDYSSALSNPAGLGMYNRSEITFTPALTFRNNSASYSGSAREESNSNLNIPGFSFVFNFPKDNDGFLGGSLGITFTRTNDFNGTTFYEGGNPNSSIIDYFVDDATGLGPSQFQEGNFQYNSPTGLAYYNYLIGPRSIENPPGPSTEYFTYIDVMPFQQELIESKGASNQWSISYGGNFNDIVFFGGGIGVSSLRYSSSKIFAEEFQPSLEDDNDPKLNSLQLEENLSIRGSGINATLGLIARPTSFLQIGISYVTPTYYTMTETYDAILFADWVPGDYIIGGEEVSLESNQWEETDVVTSDYNLTIPSKFSAGVAFISKFGFITGDIELTNPSKSRYSSNISGIDFKGENSGIREAYHSVLNYRIGAEYRHDMFRFRAGYSAQEDPYSGDKIVKFNNTIKSISVGAGIKTKSFFVDLAVIQSRSENAYVPYSFINFPLPTPVVSLENKTLNAMLTVGFTF